MLRFYSLVVFFLLNGLLCYVDVSESMGISVILTFMMNLICITIGFYWSTANRSLNLDTIVWVFVYAFFYLAPIVQLNGYTIFPNSLRIEEHYVIKANLLILLWNVFYLMFRRYKRTNHQAIQLESSTQEKSMLSLINWKLRLVYFCIALFVFIFVFARLNWSFFLGYTDYSNIISDKSLLLISSISFSGIVFANWLFAFAQWREQKKVLNLIYIGLSSIIMLYITNPLNSNRSYIGFCIIFIIYFFYHKKISSGKFLFFIFFGLFVIFPFLNMFRYGFRVIEMPSLNELMFSQLTELHFDAYSNIIATFKYCELYGLSLGYQMLGVLFFFIPRSIWLSKPLSSGEAVGDYISSLRSIKFNNISNPIVSEFYINFGVFGVIAGAIFIAYLINRLDSKLNMERYTYSLFAGYLFVIYRGDLMNAFAYCFGTYIVLVFIPMRMNFKIAAVSIKNKILSNSISKLALLVKK
jgi:hypothetical protein